ncbi:MAG: Fic family protein, partial [Terriglobales bacterium]
VQEAVLSSRIEGTQADLGQVLSFEAGQARVPEHAQADIREILNYRRALNEAERELQRRPFTLNLIRGMHATLLDNVRGANQARGEFRRVQNWIGPEGADLATAYFIPPEPNQLPGLLGSWEGYYHQSAPDALVQLALLHAQFEFLHPFIDGNGRIGRLLIPLYLYEKKLLSRPAFYLSEYLEAHRAEYYGHLRALGREPHAWLAWCRFFITAVATQADGNSRKVQHILDLYGEYKAKAIELTRSPFAVPVLDGIFEHVFFSTSQLLARPGMPTRAALLSLLKRLTNAGMLEVVEPAKGPRPLLAVCPELYALCEGKEPQPSRSGAA